MTKKKVITQTANDLCELIAKAKMDKAMRKSKNTNAIKNLHKNLARVLTAEREKELYAKV